MSTARPGRAAPITRPRERGFIRFIRSWAALAVVCSLSCVSTRLQPESLPEEPIAFLHWADKAASKRADLFEKAAEAPPPPSDVEHSSELELLEKRIYLSGEETPALSLKLSKYPGRLMLYWPRTGELERVAAAPVNARPLAWSADHKRLLFVSDHRDGKQQLYEYHVERRDLSPITIGPAEHPEGDYSSGPSDDPTAAPRMVIHQLSRRGRDGPTRQSVYLAGPGGRLERTIAGGFYPGGLELTPDGSGIVYEKVEARPRSDGPTVYESWIATRGTEPGAEEQILIKGREPTLTPDGEWIVFASESSAGYRLRRMRLDGTSRVPIGPGGSEERMPAVSPDGGFVAFIQVAGNKRRLAVRRYDGKQERVLLAEGWSEFPVW
jgi:Tol biopolymer transport system component